MRDHAVWVEGYTAHALSGDAHSNASLLGSQNLQAAHTQQHLHKEHNTAAWTVQLNKELTTISFLGPPILD